MCKRKPGDYVTWHKKRGKIIIFVFRLSVGNTFFPPGVFYSAKYSGYNYFRNFQSRIDHLYSGTTFLIFLDFFFEKWGIWENNAFPQISGRSLSLCSPWRILRDLYHELLRQDGGSSAAGRFAVWIWIRLCINRIWWISLLNLSTAFEGTSSYEMWT